MPLVTDMPSDTPAHVHPDFARLLKQRRKQLDLTQEELGEQVGCATETIRRLEAGGRRPSKVIAQRLADALQLPPEERGAFLRLARASGEAAPVPVATSTDGTERARGT